MDNMSNNFRRLPFAVPKGMLLYKESADCIYLSFGKLYLLTTVVRITLEQGYNNSNLRLCDRRRRYAISRSV